MTNIIAFAPASDTKGRKDATGAFQPEAKAFLLHHRANDDLFLVSNRSTKDAMRKQVLLALEVPRLFSRYAPATIGFFCHGLGRRIQFGFDTRNVDELAQAIRLAQGSEFVGEACPRVVLYACNTGMASLKERYAPVGGDGGFADALRDALCRAGAVNCQVDAHTTAGHTTRNPFVRRFEGKCSRVGGVGGYMLVAPGSALWSKWRRALATTTIRYEFPMMSVSEIHERLVRS